MNTTNPQQLRNSALSWQLKAIDAQARALQMLSEEHSFSVHNLAPDVLQNRVHDLAQTAVSVAAGAHDVPLETTLAHIASFKKACAELRADADKFAELAAIRAHMRLDNTITKLIASSPEVPTTVPDPEMPSAETMRLLSKANQSCFNAETEQYNTFTLQIKAVCDLALEMLFVSAAYAGTRSE